MYVLVCNVNVIRLSTIYRNFFAIQMIIKKLDLSGYR